MVLSVPLREKGATSWAPEDFLNFRSLLLMEKPRCAGQTLGGGPCSLQDWGLRKGGVLSGTDRLWGAPRGQPGWLWGLPLPLPKFPQTYPDLELIKGAERAKQSQVQIWSWTDHLASLSLSLPRYQDWGLKYGTWRAGNTYGLIHIHFLPFRVH